MPETLFEQVLERLPAWVFCPSQPASLGMEAASSVPRALSVFCTEPLDKCRGAERNTFWFCLQEKLEEPCGLWDALEIVPIISFILGDS